MQKDNPADILIDLHGCNEMEKRVLVAGLQLLRVCALGKVDKIAEYLNILLIGEEEERKGKICSLLQKVNRVLWKGRKPRSVYDGVSLYAALAWQLESRVAQDEKEVARIEDLLARVFQTKGGSTP